MTRDANIMALSELPALVLTDGEQTGLRHLLNELGPPLANTTIALERRGLTNPLIATVEDPTKGEASFLIALGVFVELDGFPARDEPISPPD